MRPERGNTRSAAGGRGPVLSRRRTRAARRRVGIPSTAQRRCDCRAAEGADRAARGLHLFRRYRRGRVRDGCVAAANRSSHRAHRPESSRVSARHGGASRQLVRDAARTQSRSIDELKSLLLQRGDVVEADAPHAQEHCLEVQLPFLQMLFDDFTLLPLVLGSPSRRARRGCARAGVGRRSDAGAGELRPESLSHLRRRRGRSMQRPAPRSCVARPTLAGEQACGAVGINGLLHLAGERQLPVVEIARCNSGDTAGDRSRVVGYGAFAVHEPGHA